MSKKQGHRPISMDVLERTAQILRVIAHPHRLKMIELIAERELTVGELAEEVGIAPNVCSQHLNTMKARQVLSSRRRGRATFYSIENPHALNVLTCIRRHAD